jgi:phospholipase C
LSILTKKIKHVVVLMLENRSFDNMLGALYNPVNPPPRGQQFEGLPAGASNPYDPPQGQERTIYAWNENNSSLFTWTIPDPDPGELFSDMNEQQFGLNAEVEGVPKMDGFVNNYMAQAAVAPPGEASTPAALYSPEAIMHYFVPEQLPALSTLARAFAVSDQWYGSAPDQTWPNRFFVHTGTAHGYVNNEPFHFPYLMHTVFNRFKTCRYDRKWRVYFHDFPQSLALARLWFHADHFHFYDAPFERHTFKRDAASGRLPSYSFIEPRYFPDPILRTLPNDQHPPHDVRLGDQLIADVYNTLRDSPHWKETLLVITYDEHGGCYDHVPPPSAVPPDSFAPDGFNFNRYGVRVPAVVISPHVEAGTVLRPVPNQSLPQQGPPYPFDHTSIIATLRKCFKLGGPLGNRDAVAPDLEVALTLEKPENLGPRRVEGAPGKPSQEEVETHMKLPPSEFQRSLVAAAAHLPSAGGAKEHVKALAAGRQVAPAPAHATKEDAALYVKEKVRGFLGKP